MKITNKTFHWPIWFVLVIFLVPAFFLPVPMENRLGDIENSICMIGYLLVFSRYLWGWKRGGTVVDFIIYSFIGLFMPYLSGQFVDILCRAIH